MRISITEHLELFFFFVLSVFLFHFDCTIFYCAHLTNEWNLVVVICRSHCLLLSSFFLFFFVFAVDQKQWANLDVCMIDFDLVCCSTNQQFVWLPFEFVFEFEMHKIFEWDSFWFVIKWILGSRGRKFGRFFSLSLSSGTLFTIVCGCQFLSFILSYIFFHYYHSEFGIFFFFRRTYSHRIHSVFCM